MMSKHLLVCDLDNTLYDWVGYFVPSFYAMVDKVIAMTGWDRDKLLDDFRTVHQVYGDSEHPFALLETDYVRRSYPGESSEQLAQRFDPAFHVFNSMRKERLKLFPTVKETLTFLKHRNVRLVAHTESKLYAVLDRLSRLELSPYFELVYCATRSENPHPRGSPQTTIPAALIGKVRELSHHQRKPDATVLEEICRNVNVSPADAAYVGDSIARDVLMAKSASVYAIWAEYGSRHDRTEYDDLVRITHWTAADVEREKRLAREAAAIRPDFIARRRFADILESGL